MRLPTTSPNGGGVVLSLCDLTGNMVRPWLDRGYAAITVDTQHPDGTTADGDLYRVGADLLTWTPPLARYAFVAAFPPCTDLAVSGARWFKSKGLSALIDALTLVDRCREIAEWTGAPWMLENPVSTISTYWRKPDHTFDPYEYGGYDGGGGDGYTKRTCLWTGGGFVMPPPRPIGLAADHDRIHKAAPGPERANFRSATPVGFAEAVAEHNAKQEVLT